MAHENFLNSKSIYFFKSPAGDIFLSDVGNSIRKKLEELVGTLFKAEFNTQSSFFAYPENDTVIDLGITMVEVYKQTTKAYRLFPFSEYYVRGTNTCFLSYYTESSFNEDLLAQLSRTISWFNTLGVDVSTITTNRPISVPDVSAEVISLVGQDTDTFYLEAVFTINQAPHKVVFRQKNEKIDYMDSNGYRQPAIILEVTWPNWHDFLLDLFEAQGTKLCKVLNPYPCVVLSVSEKWEGVANLVAMKLNAKLDSSAESVGKKVKTWKDRGAYSIFVVGEKDMQALFKTGSITLVDNQSSSAEPLVLKFI